MRSFAWARSVRRCNAEEQGSTRDAPPSVEAGSTRGALFERSICAGMAESGLNQALPQRSEPKNRWQPGERRAGSPRTRVP